MWKRKSFALRGLGYIPELPLFRRSLGTAIAPERSSRRRYARSSWRPNARSARRPNVRSYWRQNFARLGDEMLAPDRDSARSNRDVTRPTHNNDRRESPSKSKGVVSLTRENKGCPALKNEIKTTKECKRCAVPA
jgi:hypothetical protein